MTREEFHASPVGDLNPELDSKQESKFNRLAVSHGEPLRWEDNAPTTLGEALQRAAQFEPDKGIVYIQSDTSERVQSYGELLQEAQQILAGLRELGLKPQDKVIFQLERNQDFIPAFWGCILGGFVPVPIAVAPTYEQPNSITSKLQNAWEMLGQPIVLTSARLAPAVRSLSERLQLENFHVEAVDDLQGCEPDQNYQIGQPDDLTLLMLTSGSTGIPKAVMLSHRNILSGTTGMIQMHHLDSQEISLNWFPLDHVVGLVMWHIRDVYLGCQQIHAPIEAVLNNPLKWLDWISRYQATVTWAPNFAYGLVNLHPEEISQRCWDLSSMQYIINGGEAIVDKTARRFMELLCPHKLPPTAMRPAWGMSETSSGVVFSDRFTFEATRENATFVELGTPIPGISLRIVDDQDQVVEENVMGHLQVKGMPVTSGYYQNPELNRQVFTEDGWFRTGDIGFIREGHLTLTGRAKDVIIINAINYPCYEIEATVEDVEHVVSSYTSACAVRPQGSETERLAIFFNSSVSDEHQLVAQLKEIRSRVTRRFGVKPDYLIPLEKEAIPKTSIGKIQRSQLKNRFEAGEFNDILKQLNIASSSDTLTVPKTEIQRQIAQIWQEVLGLETVGIYENFFELGGHSLLLMQAQSKLQEYFGQPLSVVDLFKYPTIEALAKYLSQKSTEKTAAQIGQERAKHRSQRQAIGNTDVAVIGMSCRFPGADNINELWQNLREGVESITFFTDEELLASGVNPALLNHPNYVKASPILSDVESFDAEFFGYSAKEAQLMDPQQRLLHECAWESLEDAGYNPLTYSGAIGLYAGASTNTYWLNNIFPNRHQLDANDDLRVATVDSMGGLQMMIANDKDYLTTRVSYKLNLIGPSVNVQTACSTSLVAIHMACQSLLNGECDMVLAGGVSVQVPQKIGHLYQDGMIVSPDGHCRAFDAEARGTIFGSGVGLVVLKRLEEAMADGDRIYAVIKGTAINNDGAMKVGYTAPKGDGQAAVATEAMAMAGIEAETITYVETHGTGTVLGDPIEIEGLTQAFRSSTEKKNFCAIASVKTNVGHLQIASGIVGFIKTALALHHKLLPPSLHFETPNPKIDFANSPFYVNTKLSEWKTDGIPRRAGVNSLGIGGTNAHVILEEAPETASVHSRKLVEQPYAAKERKMSSMSKGKPSLEGWYSSDKSAATAHTEDLIAIIGMACRFPGAKDYNQFWLNLENGINSITEVPSNRWDIEKFYSSNPDESNKSISKWGGFIEEADKFDSLFFRISPREAKRMDPQQRLMLELSWSCLEDAAYSPLQLSGSNIGVFIGVCNFDYKELQEKYEDKIEGHTSTGSYTCIIPNRISYFFNFYGPSIPVDTACSSSLVAIHQAISSLHENECEMALVGGVSVLCTPTSYISFSKLGMLSPQGQCKTFDAKADGYVRGEGAGVILLKPLRNAIKDSDRIYGVIKGSAVNHGGAARTLTSPNAYAQSKVIRAAYTKAGIPPNTVSYIEAHGTGTPLGDPIEINGLKRAFTQLHQQYDISPSNEPYCGLGSVKTNIGHLEAAAGIAGIIKVLLAMKHKKLPMINNFSQLNPRITLEGSPFYIVEETKYWEQLKTRTGEIIPRRAGVSSFGFGGVNAHVVLEEPPTLDFVAAEIERPKHLLTLSTKSEQALGVLVQSYVDFLASHPEALLADICFTANVGRSHFNHRLGIVASDSLELLETLRNISTGQESADVFKGQVSDTSQPEVVFLFTGQGSQYVGMGRQLYETQPTFRQTLNHCDEILRPYLEQPLLSILYPDNQSINPKLDETAYTQPALFALEYALFELWKSWGVEPAVVMGHSVGEYVAACVAGVFTLEEGLKLIAHRGRVMQALPPEGEMVAVFADYARVRDAIQPYAQQVAIAAINAPENIVISGERKAVRDAIATLSASGVKTKPLNVSHAFHSPLMEPILAEFEQVAREITYSSPKIKLISNLTGEFATDEIATPDYWCRHIQQPVKFAAGMETLHRNGYKLFIECGPKPTLLGMSRYCLPESEGQWLPSLRPGHSDWQQMLQSCAALYVNGVSIDWSGFDRDYTRRRLQLPTYPFMRSRYWFDQKKADGRGQKAGGVYPDVDSTSYLATDQDLLVQAPTESMSVTRFQERFQSPCENYLLPSASCPLPFQMVQDLPTEEKTEVSLRWETVVAASSYQAQQGPFDLELHAYQAKLESYDSLTTAYIISALQNLGIYRQAAERHSVETLLPKFNILPTYQKLLSRWLERLVTEGILQQEKQVFVNQRPLPKASVDSCLHQARERSQNAPQLINFIQRCGENLADVLIGKVKPRELIFPGGSSEITNYLYQQSPEARYFNAIARSVMEGVVKSQPQAKSLRILEVGAGTGGTTGSLLPILPKERTSYWFTDVSNLFLEKAKQKFKTYPFVRYSLLDIERNPQNQGYPLHSFDVVVAVNVLHATRDIEETLENVRSLLAPDGLLLVIQVTNPQSWFDISFGLLDGLQRFEDNIRGNNPLLSSAQWKSVLNDCGFERVLALPSSESPTEILGQNVIVAQSELLAKDSRDFFELTWTRVNPEPAVTEAEESPKSDRLVATEPSNSQQSWESRLHEKVASILGISIPELNIDTSLTNLGFNSLMAVELTNWIAKELQVNIPVVSFPAGASITQLTNQVREAMDCAATKAPTEYQPYPCLIPLQPQGSKPPFFCVHPIAGVVFPYYELTSLLGKEQPFYGLQSFSLAGEGKPLTRIEEIAAHSIKAMQTVQPQGPYFLGGWSFGAYVAFEMAQQLHKDGQNVALLAVLDMPRLSGNKTGNFLVLSKIFFSVSLRYIWSYIYDYFYLTTAVKQPTQASKSGWVFDSFSSFMKSSAVAKIVLQESNFLQLRQPILRHLLPVVWSNSKALVHYVPKVYPGKITLFQTSQPLVANQQDISWGWKDLSLKEVEICQIPGHHLNCLRMPYVKEVAEKLATCIERIESKDSIPN